MQYSVLYAETLGSHLMSICYQGHDRGSCISTTGECILAMSTLASSPPQQELISRAKRRWEPTSSAFWAVYFSLYLVRSWGMISPDWLVCTKSAPGAQLPAVPNSHQIYVMSTALVWAERPVWTYVCARYGLAAASSSLWAGRRRGEGLWLDGVERSRLCGL